MKTVLQIGLVVCLLPIIYPLAVLAFVVSFVRGGVADRKYRIATYIAD